MRFQGFGWKNMKGIFFKNPLGFCLRCRGFGVFVGEWVGQDFVIFCGEIRLQLLTPFLFFIRLMLKPILFLFPSHLSIKFFSEFLFFLSSYLLSYLQLELFHFDSIHSLVWLVLIAKYLSNSSGSSGLLYALIWVLKLCLLFLKYQLEFVEENVQAYICN